MASSSDFTIRDDMTFTDVFHTLKAKFGLPLPPEEITQDSVGPDAFKFFTQTKFLLTYSRRNFAAAVREFDSFANLDNLADETLSKASGILSTERRQTIIQKRRLRSFNQELRKQLQLFNRDGGSIATQVNQRQSVISANPAEKQAATERSSSVMKATDKTRQRILDWQHNNLAAGTSESSIPVSRSGLRTRESFDNEINAAFPHFYEEPTEIDIETDESGMIPAKSFRADNLPGALPETLPPKTNNKTHKQSHPTSSFSHPPPSSHPLDTSVHSPPAKPVPSQNRNWGRYVPPAESLMQPPTSTQVPKLPAKHIPTSNSSKSSKSSMITAPKSDSFAPSTSSDPSTRRLHPEDAKKRKQNYPSRDIMERPTKRQSPGPQDRPQPINVPPPKLVSGAASSRDQTRQQQQQQLAENQMPNPQGRSNPRYSFGTDTTEESISDSMLRSRNDYISTQPTSFNSTMEGKAVTDEEGPERYDDLPQDRVPPAPVSRGDSHIGPVHSRSRRAVSAGSNGPMNTSRSVMRRANRPASPSTQLQSEQEEASSRDSYSVGGSTLEEMKLLGLPGPNTNKRSVPLVGSRQQSPPAAGAMSRIPAQRRRHPSMPPAAGPPPQLHRSATEPGTSTAQTRAPLSRSLSSKDPKLNFYKTLEGERFPGDRYEQLYHNLETLFWLQWETQRIILATNARNTEADRVPQTLEKMLTEFRDEPDMGYEDVQDRLKAFGSLFKQDDKYSIQNINRDSYAAIFRSEAKWDNRISLTADFKLEKVPDPKGTSRQVWKPTLRPRPLSLRSACSRIDEKFSSHRLMSLRIPKIDAKSNTMDANVEYEAIARYLSHEGFVYLGRRWRAIHHRPASKDENGNRISHSKQEKNLQVTIIMFAESGPGLDFVDHRSAVEWMIPIIELNLDMSQCKFYSRIALAFSTTTPAFVFMPDEILELDDIRVEGVDEHGNVVEYSLTDGCGLVSPAVFRAVARNLGLPYPPSAVQARIAGAKGLWIVDPSAPPESDDIWIKIRPDQNKFKGISDAQEHRTLHVCSISKPLTRSALNIQFINILLHNGVIEATLKELLHEHIDNEIGELFEDGKISNGPLLRKYFEKFLLNGPRGNSTVTLMKGRIPMRAAERGIDLINAGFTTQNKMLGDCVKTIFDDHCESIKKKMRICIAQSCMPYCVPDPSGKLRNGQVYLRFGPESKFINPKTMMPMDCLQGEILIGRNPAHFGSDIQKVTAVDIPELRHLTDVIVFPADPESTDRSLADYLSGGDYDGDRVWTCWDQRLVREFKGEPQHGPSTVHIEQYFETDRRTMREDFGHEDESPTAFADFIQRQLQIAMRDSILGQCTSFHENFVYANYDAEGGVLNLEPAKILGVICNKSVDAPKQGIHPKPEYWELIKEMHGKWRQPAYKMKKLLSGGELRRAEASRHPIDKLKFRVTKQKVAELMELFEKSHAGASYRDEDLIAYNRHSFARYTTLMTSLDPVLKLKAEAYNKQKNHLNAQLECLRNKWGAHWSEEFELGDEKGSDDSKAFIEDCVDDYDSIVPCADDDSMIASALVDEWEQHLHDPYSDWHRLKASLLYEKLTSRTDSRAKLAWFVAGDIYCFEKWRAVSEGRHSGFVMQPISRASRIKASALRTAADDRNWISGGPADVNSGGDESGGEYED